MRQRIDQDVTAMLVALRRGETEAESQLLTAIYGELRLLARRFTRSERADHTLNPTALVHEAYLKLLAGNRGVFEDRVHFFAIAARVMRQILVDYARSRAAGKRGAGAARVPIENLAVASMSGDPEELLALDAAMTRLAAFAPRQAQIVEMRFFGGMSEEEVASRLDLASRTVRRDWNMAKSWLFGELKPA